jgi:hypothetical protein
MTVGGELWRMERTRKGHGFLSMCIILDGGGGGWQMDGARLIKRRTRVQSHEGPLVGP